MMCYKDMTFCPGPCANTNCFRHKSKIDHVYLKANPFLPVAWFIEVPVDCQDRIIPDESIS